MNIYDIAEKCGVSIATVSRVLNDNPKVRAQTRERVLAVMQQEGYTPNAFARGLGLGSTSAVGVLCADLSSPLYAEMLQHVETALRRSGQDMILRAADGSPEEEKRALEFFLQKRVDAVLSIGTTLCEESDTQTLKALACQIPVVLLDSELQAPGVYSVTADVAGAMETLLQALFFRHKRRVLFLYDAMTDSCRRKMDGYRAAYAAQGEAADEALLVSVERRLEAVNECVKRLLVRGVSFDAVIGADDLLALGAQKSLHRIGLKIPVIGFHNSVLARVSTPELSSVDVDVTTLCETALARLRAVLAKETVPAHTTVPTALAERDSFRLN